jgi:peptidoglycan/LPS O-acetylase OafA/YrhL
MNNIVNYNSTKYITALRAYAALSVYFIHSGGFGFREMSVFTNRLVDFGKFGVTVFFVLSAFTICMSIDKSNKFEFKNYLIRRFFRVAPLYYIVLIIAFLLGGSEYYLKLYNVDNDISSLLFHFSFLNVFIHKHQNNIIGLEWSVPIEFFYYLIIPFAFFYYNKTNKIIIGVLVSSIISLFSSIIYQHFYPHFLFNWSIFKYAFSFNFGILIYILFRNNILVNTKNNNLILILLFLILGIYILFNFEYKDLFVTVFTGILILLFQNESAIKELFFENKIILFLGKISYSIYLIHFLFLYHLKIYLFSNNPIFILSLVLLVSTISYYTIEKPFIDLSSKIINKK